MSKYLTASVVMDAAGLIGAALVAYGFWLAFEPAGFLVAGLLLLAGAILSARTNKESRK